MIIDSYSIFFKNLIKIHIRIVYFLKNSCFLSKNINLLLDLLSYFCYIVYINKKLSTLSFYQFFLKKYIDFFKNIDIIVNINSSLT